MSTSKPKPPIQPTQANAFQRFTIRLVNGQFVRVPKSDLPSVESQVDKTLISNQTEMRDLFRSVHGQSVIAPTEMTYPEISPEIPLPADHYPDPTFDLPE